MTRSRSGRPASLVPGDVPALRAEMLGEWRDRARRQLWFSLLEAMSDTATTPNVSLSANVLHFFLASIQRQAAMTDMVLNAPAFFLPGGVARFAASTTALATYAST